MIIQCDFDGTITTNNLSVLLRERFASSEWQEIESNYIHGRLTVEQSNGQQYKLIKESKKTLQEFAYRNVKFRSGFLQFIENCWGTGIRFVIVSSGLDFYIEAALSNIGAPNLELYCAQTSFEKSGITVTYLDPEGNFIENGFKRRYLSWLRNQDKPLIYMGDGLSDLDAAYVADYVFAVDQLHSLLSANSVPHYIFSNFSDVWQQLCHLRGLS